MVFLPEGLRIDGDLLLRGTSIRELPEMLDVRGKIELEGCKSLTRLCDDLRVGGDLDLEGCDAITTLPQNMFVGGNLYLAGTKISEIPASAIVKGMVYDLAA
jgi:hypothetical protein